MLKKLFGCGQPKKTPYFQPDFVPVGYTVDAHYLRNEHLKPKLALQLHTRRRLWREKYGMSAVNAVNSIEEGPMNSCVSAR